MLEDHLYLLRFGISEVVLREGHTNVADTSCNLLIRLHDVSVNEPSVATCFTYQTHESIWIFFLALFTNRLVRVSVLRAHRDDVVEIIFGCSIFRTQNRIVDQSRTRPDLNNTLTPMSLLDDLFVLILPQKMPNQNYLATNDKWATYPNFSVVLGIYKRLIDHIHLYRNRPPSIHTHFTLGIG